MDGAAPSQNGGWTIIKIAGSVIGGFLVLLFGVFIIHGKFSSNEKFFASFFSAVGDFMGREEFITEIDLSARDVTQFLPCEYGEGEVFVKSPVVFNEIAWMGTAENYNAEWMELKNVSDVDADISFWRIFESDGRVSIVVPKDTKIPAGGFYVLARDISDKNVSGNLSYEGALVNTGTNLRLYDASCSLADEVRKGNSSAQTGWPAGDNKTKQTMERTATLTWQTSSIVGGTPGGENSTGVGGIASPKTSVVYDSVLKDNSLLSYEGMQDAVTVFFFPVFVNEIYVGDANSSLNEYVEFFNSSENPVLLTGWSLKKKSSTGVVNSLVSASRLEGESIPAKGFFLIANEGGNFASVSDAVWARSNTLAYSNNAILLVNPNGEIVQEILWSEIPKGSSFSRQDDGNYAKSIKTPGSKNE